MDTRLTNLSASDLEDFFLLGPRVFSSYRDPKRGKFSIVYNFSQTTDNEKSGLLTILNMARLKAMCQIGICQGSTENGYAGYEHSVESLHALGFDLRSVPITPIRVDRNVNTGSEAEALARYCTSLTGDIGVVAPAFHLVRVFMTMVSVMYRLGNMCRVYPIVGAPLPWNERVRHSQGILQNTRAGLVADELSRLEKYRASQFGSMVSAQQVLKYLDWRDANAKQ